MLLALAARTAPAEERPSSAAQIEFFENSIRPLLSANCFECHGSKKQKGGLRLDSRAAMLAGGDSGRAVVPAKPEESLLITAVNYADTPQMPPKGKLKAKQIAALTTWVKQGAPWPELTPPVRSALQPHDFQITAQQRAFWAFQTITDPPVPAVRHAEWPKSSLDYFVLARQETSGLHSVGPADKRTWIRRVNFDLIGLPPTVPEIDAFVDDHSAYAKAKVVDRLLASPHYGERWARHWLDVARYGEDQAHSFQPRLYPNGYRYRDWLIRAFNKDMPYDRFIKEQIAGDLLDGAGGLERLAALGFFALGPVYYGDPQKLDQLDDRIDTLCRGFLGLTVACARCHDHKFDPISTKDYYALAGVFASSEYVEVPLVPPEVVEAAKRNQTAEEKKKKTPLNYAFVHSLKEGPKAIDMRVRIRGNADTPAEAAPRRFLAILGGEAKPFSKGSGRLELAEAIARKDNPLTARVMVNRIWQHHFGKGLVRTPSNFGVLGERPTHPELLDHLARRFIQSGWSIKALQREIVLSATYQQSSRSDPGNEEVDPENRLCWRVNRRRLEVEAWRDALLAVTGKLSRTIGGPSADLASADNRRRTLYARISRHELNGLLRLFDFPDPNITCDERTITTVPLQQLFVLNSEFMARSARTLAAQLAAGPGRDDAARIRRAFPLLYGRPVTEQELRLGLDFLHDPDRIGSDASTALTPWEQYAQVLLSANEFLYVD